MLVFRLDLYPSLHLAPASDHGCGAAARQCRLRARRTTCRAVGVMTEHPVNGLDDVVHQRVRLGILTIAHEARRVEFGFLRTALDLTAGNLGQHLSVLEKAGLVHIEKGYEGKRPRTWVNLTPEGEKALRDEIAHLKRLIQQVEQAPRDLHGPGSAAVVSPPAPSTGAGS